MAKKAPQKRTPAKKSSSKAKKVKEETKVKDETEVKEEAEVKEEPIGGKRKRSVKKEKEEEEEEKYEWWNDTEKSKDGKKWKSLVHNGPVFPPEYVPHHIPLIYDGTNYSYIALKKTFL